MDLPKLLTDDEYRLFKKELRLTEPYHIEEWDHGEKIFTDDEVITYGRICGSWVFAGVRRRALGWAAWETLGTSIINVSAVNKLELYPEDVDG